jgi:hypothetical protein
MRGRRARTPRKSSAGPPLSPPSGAPALGYARDVDTSLVGHGRALAARPGGRDWIGDSTRETIKWSVRMMSGARRGDELLSCLVMGASVRLRNQDFPASYARAA